MDGSADGTGRVPETLAADPASGALARVRHDLLQGLACEPFVLLVLALDAVILCLSPAARVRSDTWLALVAGRLVSNSGLPHHDTLTVWAHGRAWVDQQWLRGVPFFLVHPV